MSKGVTSGKQRFIPLLYKEMLPAELQIIEVQDRSVRSKPALIRIDKMSSKSLYFLSELLFPVNPQIIILFRCEILLEPIELLGYINWSQREQETNLYEAVLISDEPTRNKLVFMLNNLARKYMPAHMRAEFYYHYFTDSIYDFKNSRINLWG